MDLEGMILKAYRRDPELADFPDKLLLVVWRDCVQINQGALPVRNFLQKVIDGEIDMPKLSSIDRIRRQVQEMNPEYQGKLRELRKEKGLRITEDYHESKIEKLL